MSVADTKAYRRKIKALQKKGHFAKKATGHQPPVKKGKRK